MASNSKLATQQRKAITEAAKSIVAATTSTAPIDRAICVDAIGAAYDYLGLRSPEIIFLTAQFKLSQSCKNWHRLLLKRNHCRAQDQCPPKIFPTLARSP